METIIFCGIQATGKTTFYLQHFFKSHIRISMDQLNTRNKERQFMDLCLNVQQPFVVDNTNPTIEERKVYVEAAKSKKFKVKCFYFQSKIEEAFIRNGKRTGKDFIPEVGIRGTFSKLTVPAFEEGFDEIFYVSLEDNQFIIKKLEYEV